MKNIEKSFFDEVIDRSGTASLKWNIKENELPMWVADMDFRTAPAITQAIADRAAHGIYGYTVNENEWYEAYQNWWEKRHGFKIEREWLIFCTGVIPALSSIVRKLTTPAENVVVMTPVYNHFYSSILNNGRNVLESPLVCKDGIYEIDFNDLENKLSDPQTSMMILCNPHNPTGNIWDKAILEKIGHLCVKHHVIVVSDEIHCDITRPGKDYIPFASVSDECKNNSITCVAPTKTFNIAGLQTAAVIVPDGVLRHRVNRGLNTDEVAEPNVFAAIAPVAAYNNGEQWLDTLREYIWDNRAYAKDYLKEQLPEIRVIEAEATYLMWIDCTAVTNDSYRLCRYIRKNTGLFVSDGSIYRNADGFIRVNLACPKKLLIDGMKRLVTGIKKYKAEV